LVEKIALAELVAFTGQIEHLMRLVLDRSTFGPRDRGSQVAIHPFVFIHDKTLGPAQSTWIKALRKRLTSNDFRQRAEVLATRIEGHINGRNHFLHAVYAHFPMDGGRATGLLMSVAEHARGLPGPVMARRTKTSELRPVEEVLVVRDEAASISAELHRLYEDMCQTDIY
jgi:hypothetical protein